MRLRKQLVLLSLATLILPWAGVKTLQKFEQTMRDAQVQTLQATSKAIAAITANQNDWLYMAPKWKQQQAPRAFVVHPLQNSIVVDGYFDDWRAYQFAAQMFLPTDDHNKFTGNVVAGVWQNTAYLYLTIEDSNRQFFNPSQTIAECDHVSIELPSQQAVFNIFSAAPGKVSVSQQNHASQGVVNAIKGVWHEQESNYQLELQMPFALLKDGIKITAYDGALQKNILLSERVILPIAYQIPSLQKMLEQFTEPGLRLYVTDENGYVLADAGALHGSAVHDPYAGIAHKAVSLLIGKRSAPEWQEVKHSNMIDQPAGTTLEGFLNSHVTLERNAQLINRAFSPVYNDGWKGFVIAEKNSTTVNTLVTGATGTLLLYSLLASVFVGVLCIAYASWLSYRIRKLSKLLDSAIDEHGNVHIVLPIAKSNDELGELARSYSILLRRLKEYTDYLQNLSGKLSHELRTPLAVVKSSLENMQLSQLDESTQQYAERAQAGAARLANLLNAMSAANRIEQSLQHAEFEQMDIKQLLLELNQAYQDVYPQQSIELDITDDAIPMINIAPDLIAQMLDKLIENAVDFSQPNSTITIMLAQEKAQIFIRVINVGPPLPEQMQYQLFDSLVSMRQESEGHFGLGLYIVRLIARFHQGAVRAFNRGDFTKGNGEVVFEVSLPLS